MPMRSTSSSAGAEAGGILEDEGAAAKTDGLLDDVAGGTGDRRDNRAVGARRRLSRLDLPGVGFADDGGARTVADDASAREAVVENDQIGGKTVDFSDDRIGSESGDVVFVGKIDRNFEMCSDNDDLVTEIAQASGERTGKLREGLGERALRCWH